MTGAEEEGKVTSDGSVELENENSLKGVAGGERDGYRYMACPLCGTLCGAYGFSYVWNFDCGHCGNSWTEYDL